MMMSEVSVHNYCYHVLMHEQSTTATDEYRTKMGVSCRTLRASLCLVSLSLFLETIFGRGVDD